MVSCPSKSQQCHCQVCVACSRLCISPPHGGSLGLNRVCPLQVAQKPFRLTDDFVAPKGTLIMPSIVAANMQVSSPCVPPSVYLHS